MGNEKDNHVWQSVVGGDDCSSHSCDPLACAES